MREIWTFALNNPHLLYVPAVGFILSLIVIRIKKRYIEQGILFRRGPGQAHDSPTTDSVGEYKMPSENEIDLSIALSKLHELAVSSGDLEHAYWYRVGQLLQRASGMQVQINSLNRELELYRARLRKTD
jgi:hypothetical protein